MSKKIEFEDLKFDKGKEEFNPNKGILRYTHINWGPFVLKTKLPDYIIKAYRNGHCKFHGIEELNVDFKADDLWINFMKAGDFNPIHTHDGDYSFVVFVDVPKQLEVEQKKFEGTSVQPGALLFEYTQQAKPRWATTGSHVLPKTGDMIMFPALLQHWVCPFKSKVTRISVSGNLRITNKEKLPSDYF